jgi:predicted RNA-binding Zn-ribbon protein involved in translation (DUF1610 family)
MPVPVVCPSCATKLRAPDSAADHKTKCPKCGESVNIGGVTPEPPPVAKVYTPPVAAVYTPPSGQGVEVAPEPEKKACPFCGETVLAVARKCKHCGETIDVAQHAAEVRAAPVASVDVEPGYPPAPAVACPHCGKAMSQDGRLASQVVACPHCGGAVQMPPPAAVPAITALPPPVNLVVATPTHMSTAPGAAPFDNLHTDEDDLLSRRRGRHEAGSMSKNNKPGCRQQACGCFLLVVLGFVGLFFYMGLSNSTTRQTTQQWLEDRKRAEEQDANVDKPLRFPKSDEQLAKETTDNTKRNPVTANKYHAVKTGMTYAQVRDILGTEGEEYDRNKLGDSELAGFRWANESGAVLTVVFENGRVMGKMASGMTDSTRAQLRREATERQEALEWLEKARLEQQRKEEQMRVKEGKAAARLNFAKRFMPPRGYNSFTAKRVLKEVIKDFPDTKAAEEAKKLLAGYDE